MYQRCQLLFPRLLDQKNIEEAELIVIVVLILNLSTNMIQPKHMIKPDIVSHVFLKLHKHIPVVDSDLYRISS